MPGFDDINEVNDTLEDNSDEMTREIFMKEAARNGWNLEGEADVLENVYDIYEGAKQMPEVDMMFWQSFAAFLDGNGKSKRKVIDDFLAQTSDLKDDLDDYEQREALDELTDNIRKYDPPEEEKISDYAYEQYAPLEEFADMNEPRTENEIFKDVKKEFDIKADKPKNNSDYDLSGRPSLDKEPAPEEPVAPDLMTEREINKMQFSPEEEQTYKKLTDKTCSFYDEVNGLNHREVYEGRKHAGEEYKESEHTYTLARTGGFAIALYGLAATKKYTFDQLMDPNQLKKEKAEMFDKVVQNSKHPATPEKQQWVAKQLYEGEKVIKQMADEVTKKIDFSQPDLLHNKDFCHLTQLAFSQFDASQEMQRCKPEMLALAQKDDPDIKKFSDYHKIATKNIHPLINVASAIASLETGAMRLAKTDRTDTANAAANVFAAHDTISNTISALAEAQKNKKDARSYTELLDPMTDTQLKANYGLASVPYAPVFKFIDDDPAMKTVLIDKMADGKIFGQLKGSYTNGIEYKLSDNAKNLEQEFIKEAEKAKEQKGIDSADPSTKAGLIKNIDDKLKGMNTSRLVIFNKFTLGHSDSEEYTAMTDAMKRMKEAANDAKEPFMEDENFKEAFLEAYKASVAYTARKRKDAKADDGDLTWKPKSPLGKRRYDNSMDLIRMAEELIPDVIAADKQRELDERTADLKQSEENLEIKAGGYEEECLKQCMKTIKERGKQCGVLIHFYGKEAPKDAEEDFRASLAESIAIKTVGHFYKECEESGIEIPKGNALKEDFDKRVAQATAGIMAREDFNYLVEHNTPAVLTQFATVGNGNRLLQQLSEAGKAVNEQHKNVAPKANEKVKDNNGPAIS